MKLIPLTFEQKTAVMERSVSVSEKRESLFEDQELCDCSEKALTMRANTITPVLEDILSKLNAFPHGGINE